MVKVGLNHRVGGGVPEFCQWVWGAELRREAEASEARRGVASSDGIPKLSAERGGVAPGWEVEGPGGAGSA